MEPRFAANFGGVRIHTDTRAASLNRQFSAQAFTVGNHIFFGQNRFNPATAEGKELIAHELTHTVQQGAVAQGRGPPGLVQRSQAPAITRTVSPGIQRLGLSDALDYFAERANNIPGFRMFTIVLGVNPVTMNSVDRSAANILRAIVEFLPGGALVTQALDNYGIFDRIGNWVETQIQSLGITGSMIRSAVTRFLDTLSWGDIFDLGGVWRRAVSIFSEPINRIISFVRGLAAGILQFIKDAILRPLAELASRTRAWDLLIAVLGKNPITGDPVPRTADTLIGGFMKLIGQEEVWNNLKRANAVARAWAWFQSALSELMGFVAQIPGLFIGALQSLEIADIVLLPRAFAKVGAVFGSFFGQFVSWAGGKVMALLEIIFEVLAPAVMPYIRKAAAAFRTIVSNPIGFIGNLVRAGIQGFRQFASNFLTHLRTSLVSWLTGTLSGANIHIPRAFSLSEIIKFVLSVLGLTWQNIRQKLVRVIGETAVRVLEAGFDIVVTLVTQGPAAAWQKILEGISNLREMVMEQIMNFVRDRVVQAAITRLVTSLNPAGAFIQAIIAIYNTIMFFVERLRQIAQVAGAFIDSISAIAGGVIAAAANRVETTMAGLLTLVISFLARIAGLGRVSDAVTNIINRVRAPIDRALDRVVEWIVATARRLGKLVTGRGQAQPGTPRAEGRVTDVPEKSSTITLPDGESHTVYVSVRGGQVVAEMASSRGQLDLVLGRLTMLCQAALREYSAALQANPDQKKKIEETRQYLDHIITVSRKSYEGPGSIYREVENIISGVGPYDRLTKAQRGPAAESYISRTISGYSANLGRSVKLGFKSLEGFKFKSGYVDQAGMLLAQYRNVRRTFYNVRWSGAANSFLATEFSRLNGEAIKRQPTLATDPATAPHKHNFYWAEDKTGSVGPAYVADRRAGDGKPELDHVEPMGTRWASSGTPKPGNNTNQADRETDYNVVGNLQVLSRRLNGAKSGPSFAIQVGVDFRGPLDPP